MEIFLTQKRLKFRIVGIIYGKALDLDSQKIAQLDFFIEKWASSRKSSNEVESLLKQSRKIASRDISKAMALADKAKVLDPSNPDVYSAYASLHFRDSGIADPWEEACRTQVELLRAKAKQDELFDPHFRVLTDEWTYAIGHTAMLDFFIRAKLLGLLSERDHVLFTTRDRIANEAYLDYFTPLLKINIVSKEKYWMYSNLFRSFIESISFWQLEDSLQGQFKCLEMVQERWKVEKDSPLLTIKDEHREKGLNILEELSIPPGSWFVALHVRGEGYLSRNARDSDIFSYIPAIKAITSAGGYVFRMGHSTMKPLPKMPNVIDYIHTPYKSDWMDVFLWSCCRFFVCTLSGPNNVPPSFGVPILLTNAPCLRASSLSFYNSLMIPKLLRSKSQNRLLTFSEVLESRASYCESKGQYEEDLVLIENSSDEIEAGVVEMISLTSNNIKIKDGQYEIITDLCNPLQLELDAIREKYNVVGRLPLSRYFLNKYSDLIK